jgi:hypothetical protein
MWIALVSIGIVFIEAFVNTVMTVGFEDLTAIFIKTSYFLGYNAT